MRCFYWCSKDNPWNIEAERSQSKKLSLSIYWLCYYGDKSLQEYFKVDLLFYEKEVPRKYKDKDSTISKSPRGIRDFMLEV